MYDRNIFTLDMYDPFQIFGEKTWKKLELLYDKREIYYIFLRLFYIQYQQTSLAIARTILLKHFIWIDEWEELL